MRNLLRAAIIAGAGLLVVLGAGSASAAESPAGQPNAADLAAIGTLVSGKDTANRLATTVFPDGTRVAAETAARNAMADPAKPVAVYEPSAEFVTGKSAVPAELAYVAVPARTGDGATATVQAQREGRDWSVFNVASGDVEQRLAAEAGKGYLLHEPQVNAWYAVEGGTVRVLDGSVTGTAKGATMSVDAFRTALRDRYADKLPGSAYDREGAGGGYTPASATARPNEPRDLLVPILLGAGALALVAAGAYAVRLRRQ
ncbi:hypothetical protein [Amycolatopsis sp. NPDC058986]|uniref:hypothetical protein n=1 Tax=unclassified Amycolatopsis TaxID=2618356 RepID=UPI00366E0C07